MTDRLPGRPPPTRASEAPTPTVAVVGLGVMGGSIVKALALRAPEARVYGIDPDDESAALAARDRVTIVERLEDCALGGATVVFAAPLDVTAALVGAAAASWSGASLVTDVASLKVPVLEAARQAAAGGGVFVGAHPMCGSERSGYAAARADLYEGADVWLCPVHGDGAADSEPRGDSPLDRARAFWRLLGARPRTIAAAEHDRTMAWASHLPQLLASALALSLDVAGVARRDLGPGGRDMTRLAGSGTEMWLPLLEAARDRNVRALRTLEEQVAQLRRVLQEGDMAALARLMDRGSAWASPTD
ncbi:MAG: prephenate dehydrogenase [Gemmatimonadetes bacterium]|nr:prephenate dehydrogenase [Gemmatimonadota bacterium]